MSYAQALQRAVLGIRAGATAARAMVAVARDGGAGWLAHAERLNAILDASPSPLTPVEDGSDEQAVRAWYALDLASKELCSLASHAHDVDTEPFLAAARRDVARTVDYAATAALSHVQVAIREWQNEGRLVPMPTYHAQAGMPLDRVISSAAEYEYPL